MEKILLYPEKNLFKKCIHTFVLLKKKMHDKLIM